MGGLTSVPGPPDASIPAVGDGRTADTPRERGIGLRTARIGRTEARALLHDGQLYRGDFSDRRQVEFGGKGRSQSVCGSGVHGISAFGLGLAAFSGLAGTDWHAATSTNASGSSTRVRTAHPLSVIAAERWLRHPRPLPTRSDYPQGPSSGKSRSSRGRMAASGGFCDKKSPARGRARCALRFTVSATSCRRCRRCRDLAC